VKQVRRFLLLLILFFPLSLLVVGCFLTRPSDRKILADFEKLSQSAEIRYYDKGDYRISYIDVAAQENLPLVLLIHGAPGTFYDFKTILQDSLLQTKARLIAVDRPGYGKSSAGKTCEELEQVCDLLLPLLDLDKSGKGVVLVGHSYGGPIAARLAANYSEKVRGLVLAAAAVDPSNEKAFWFNKPLEKLGLKYLMPGPLRVANDEKVSHVEQLQLLRPLWKSIQAPVCIIHGTKDNIVSVENAYFAEASLQHTEVSTLYSEDMSHMIPWQSSEELKSMIISLL